jgi:sugar/nucleoside kinase (ribokinase family)
MNPTFVLAGRLQRDYLLSAQDHPILDQPGGSLLYSATGLGVWNNSLSSSNQGEPVGMLTRVGEDYPREWLQSFERYGWDTRGILFMAEALDLRYFQATLEHEGDQQPSWEPVISHLNPVAHFARLGLPFPKALLGYQPPAETNPDHKGLDPAAPRPNDIPLDYLNARAVHLCPLDYLTASRLSSTFRQASITTLTLDPSATYMTSKSLNDVHTLVQGLTAFLCSEEKIRSLFWGRMDDVWQMAEALGEFGCEFIVIKRGARGQLLYDSVSRKRWEIPAYPARRVNGTGVGDSFCGGFLAGYQKTYDPLRGVLHGCVSASLTIEGMHAFHALEALPGLAQARLDSLTNLVRQI